MGKKRISRGLSALLAAVLVVGLAVPASASQNGDFDHVTGHVNLVYKRQLAIHYPAQAVETTADGFQITGTSDPGAPLIFNGQEVEKRGANGTFAVYVPLAEGANSFTFSQNGESATVSITKGSKNVGLKNTAGDGDAYQPLPQFDIVAASGKVFTTKCYAPSGVSAVAIINGNSYTMTKEGSYFTAKYKLPEVNGTVNLGQVQYQITYDSKTEAKVSEGRLFVTGQGSAMQVQVKNVSATVFKEAATNSGYVMTAKQGAVDTIRESNGDMYRLSTGGWIQAKAVQPLTEPVSTKNTVSNISFAAENKGEAFTLHGTSHPLYTASHTSEGLRITFYNTTGVGGIDTSSSRLFANAAVSEQDGATTIDFALSNPGSLWGYTVEYSGGQTTVYCKYRPQSVGGSTPLQGITVAVDAGHGGSDSGALGITYGFGVTEKDINYAAAVALQKKLELLGANVIMLRDGDVKMELNQRMEIAQANKVDFLISLHSNSAVYSAKAASANGVEVYYYEGISQRLAQSVEAGIVSSTGRNSRGAKRSSYVMTLNSYCPSILVEMGFMLNPWDFDSMCSRQGVYNTVTAISNSIVSML